MIMSSFYRTNVVIAVACCASLLLLLLHPSVEAFSPATVITATPTTATNKYYQSKGQLGAAAAMVVQLEPRTSSTTAPIAPTTIQKNNFAASTTTKRLKAKMKKPKVSKFFVEDISSLNELKYFLEEDERPVVIKFYAKWCKKCQQVGKQMDRLAMEMGDRIVLEYNEEDDDNEQLQPVFVDGDVRFGQMEFTHESQAFITEELQILGVPTVQIYVGTKKLLDAGSSVKRIRSELQQIKPLDPHQIINHAEQTDDGILTSIIQESIYDSPDFLNEEW